MLRFFKINDPYRLLAILVVILLCSLPLMINQPEPTRQEIRAMVLGESVAGGQRMYIEVYDSTAPLAGLVFAGMDWVMGRSATGRDVIAFLLLFFHAAYFAILLINNKAYNDNTYVPGLIYGLLCFVSFDFLSISVELLGATVLLLALDNLFREIEFRIQRDETVLNLGVYIGIASLFVFSYSLFVVAAFVILAVYARVGIRKSLLLFLGFALPHAFMIMLYFYRGHLTDLWLNFYADNFRITPGGPMSTSSIMVLCALPIAYFVVSLFMLTREARFTKYQSQLFQVMFLWLIFSLILVLLSRDITPHSFIILIPSLTYFISYSLLLIRRKWIAESALWIFMIGVVSINYLSFHNNIGVVDYSGLFPPPSPHATAVQGKKVMVLADDPAIYRNNELGGYLLNWKVSEDVVTDTDDYRNVLKLDELFTNHPPEVIVDPNNLFPKIVNRIPSLRTKYRKEKELYWRIGQTPGMVKQ